MTRRNPPAKWVLPDTLNPIGRKCFCLSVPDDPAYIAAYRGAILALASAYNWADDEGHTAKEVAAIMRDCIDEGECSNMEFIQRDCDLFMVVGGVETLIYTAQTCIDNNIADGTLNPGTPNSGLGPKGQSVCVPYTFELSPLEIYYLPQHVDAGDTLTFINYSGGSSDIIGGGVFWWCPTGATYALGVCSGVRGPSQADDPSQSIAHASLMIQINNTYYDLFDVAGAPITFVVPSGVSNALCKVLVNYGAVLGLTATGSIKGTIEWCKDSLWCYEFDFAASDGGFTARQDTNGKGGALYVAGTGWRSIWVADYAAQSLNIGKTFNARNVTYIEYQYSVIINSSRLEYHVVNLLLNGTSVYAVSVPAANGNNTWSHDWTPSSINIDELTNEFRFDAGQTQYSYLTKIIVHGTGGNPFGASNC